MKNLIFSILFLSLTYGCSERAPEINSIVKPQVIIPDRVVTMDEWTKSILSTYKESKTKDDGLGVTRFTATFESNDGKKLSISRGERDSFRKLRIYSNSLPNKIETGVSTYVSIVDGEEPILFINPYYRGDSWIFIEKISLILDGNIVLEREFEYNSVDREAIGKGVIESYHFFATKNEIDIFRKIQPESNILVRITGKKGYENLKNENEKGNEVSAIEKFKSDISSTILIYDSINKGVKGHIPPIALMTGK